MKLRESKKNKRNNRKWLLVVIFNPEDNIEMWSTEATKVKKVLKKKANIA
jgi:hypothetical protein